MNTPYIYIGNYHKYTGNYPSDMLRYPSDLLRYPSDLLRYPSDLLRYPSDLLSFPSDKLRYKSGINRFPVENHRYQSKLDIFPSGILNIITVSRSFIGILSGSLLSKMRLTLIKVLNFLRPDFKGNSPYELTKQRFDAILKAHSDLISRICFSYATDNEDYKDLYQDVLINVWKGLANFRGEASSSTWIYRVALNTCVSTFRKRKNRPGTKSLDSIPTDLPDDSGDVDEKERLEWLHKMIAELSPIDKAIITMWLDDRSYNEIAEVVGMSPNNIGLRLHRIKNGWRKKGMNLKE